MKFKAPARRARILTFAVTVAMLGTSLMAAPSAIADPVAASCSVDDFQAGKCITAVVRGSESPMEAGVAQAIDRGERAAAERFVERRGRAHSDRTQDRLESIIDSREVDDSDPQIDVQDTGAGYVLGYTHYLKDTITYLYCSSGSCTLVGRVQPEFRYTINGVNKFYISGDVDVLQGPRVRLVDISCKTYFYRPILPDSLVKTWPNCTDAETTWNTTTTIILVHNWTGGTLGEQYYPKYRVEFIPSVTSEHFSFSWTADRYKIPPLGGGWARWQ